MSYAVAQAGVQLLYASRRPFFAMLSWQCKRQSPHGREAALPKTMPNNAQRCGKQNLLRCAAACSGDPPFAWARVAAQKKEPPWEIEE